MEVVHRAQSDAVFHLDRTFDVHVVANVASLVLVTVLLVLRRLGCHSVGALSLGIGSVLGAALLQKVVAVVAISP